MPTQRKIEAVTEVSEKLKRAQSLVVTDYRGLTVAQLQELRRKLSAANVDYLVVKNTLARRAADENGLEALKTELVGPARLVNEYIRQTRRLSIKSGLLGTQVIDADGVRRLADLPSREALLGQLAGTLSYGVARLAGAMQSVTQRLASGLEAYRRKLEEGGAVAAPASPPVAAAEPDATPPTAEAETGTAVEIEPGPAAETEAPAAGEVETEPVAEAATPAASESEPTDVAPEPAETAEPGEPAEPTE